MLKNLIAILIFISTCAVCSAQVFQLPSENKVMNTPFDTVTITSKYSSYYSYKRGFVTNEDVIYPMYVYFSFPGSTRLDSNSFVIVPAGKTLEFVTQGRSLFRRTTTRDLFKTSQTVIGSAELSAGKVVMGKVYDGRDFTGQVIDGFDLTGCSFVGCDFTNARITNCIIKDADFVDVIGLDDTDLVRAAKLLPDGSGYTFTGTQGDTVTKE